MNGHQKFTVITSTGARGYVLRKARFLDRAEQNKVVLDDGRELMVPSDALHIDGEGNFRLDDARPQSEPPPADRTAETRAPQIADAGLERQYEATPASRMNPEDVREAGVQAPHPEEMANGDVGTAEVRAADARAAEPRLTEVSRSTVETTGERGSDGTGVYRPNGTGHQQPQELTLDEHLFADEVAIERVPVNQIVEAMPETRTEGDVMIVPVVEEVLVVQKRLLLKEEVRIHRTRNQVREPRRVVVSGNETRIVGSDGREIVTGA